MTARTLYDKLWDDHVVHTEADGTAILYIDRHLVHEVTSPQAYEGLRQAGRKVWRISSVVATADHNTPTTGWERGYDGIEDPISKEQVTTLDANIKEHGAAAFFPFLHARQGIVHVIGPENGATLPGMTVVCGDSHTSTHGAFGALAHGIGTSEVEHVLATQTLLAKKARNMLIKVNGQAAPGVTAKDIVLAIIGKIGTAGGTGYTIEFGGDAIRALSMEGRMTVCNMAIEAGARAGLVAVDDKTIEYVKGRLLAPGTDSATGKFVGGPEWDQAVAYWKTLHSDPGAHFDAVVNSPGADDNASGVAGTLALARMFRAQPQARTLRFVMFVNEEPPAFWPPLVGSWVYAKQCRANNDNIVAMISLESIGYYSDQPGSQKYPRPLNWLYPDTGDFIAFVSNWSSRGLNKRAIRVFREHTKFPSEGGSPPGWLPGVGWSDHWSFWQEGYPAIMITNTAAFRNPNYHTPMDTADPLDYERMARVMEGVEAVVRDLANK